MEIEYQNVKKDFIDVYNSKWKEVFIKRSVFIVIILLFLIGGTISDHPQWPWWRYLLTIAVYILLLSAVYLIPLIILLIKLNLPKAKKTFGDRKKIIITDEFLISERGDKVRKRNWGEIKSAEYTERFISIITLDKTSLIIPRTFFPTEEDAIRFINLICSKVAITQRPVNIGVQRPPYKNGWWGLLPLIGGIHGVIMIVNGIFKYKDKKFALIGLAGVLFTVAVYAPLIYESRKGIAFVDMSKIQLNSLVKEIEFYKIQNGEYPDSLRQLDIHDSFTSIHDPILNIEKKIYSIITKLERNTLYFHPALIRYQILPTTSILR
jgi:hypothetical protein